MTTYPAPGTAVASRDVVWTSQQRDAIDALPASARRLWVTLHDAGWRWQVTWARDSGGAPYVAVEGQAGINELEAVGVTWHARNTGPLRLFTRRWRGAGRDAGWRGAPSLRALVAWVAATPVEDAEL